MPKVGRICDRCKVEFFRYPSQAGPYCSRACALGAQRDGVRPVTTTCKHCRQNFFVDFRSDAAVRIYCSRACATEARRSDRDGMKRCGKCRQTKPLDGFRRNASTVSGRSAYCKECRRGEKQPHPARRYGLSEEEYDALLEKQVGGCAICHQSQKRRLAVDHNHRTGEVRGLLCDRCNAGLGLFRDLPMFLRKAADYLEDRGGAEIHYLPATIVKAS